MGIRSKATGDSWHGGGEGGPTRHGPRCCSCGLSWEISDMPHDTLLRACRTKSACMALVRGDERSQAQPELAEQDASNPASYCFHSRSFSYPAEIDKDDRRAGEAVEAGEPRSRVAVNLQSLGLGGSMMRSSHSEPKNSVFGMTAMSLLNCDTPSPPPFPQRFCHSSHPSHPCKQGSIHSCGPCLVFRILVIRWLSSLVALPPGPGHVWVRIGHGYSYVAQRSMWLERGGNRADVLDPIANDDQGGDWVSLVAVPLPALARVHSGSPLAPIAVSRRRRKYPKTMTNILELETDLCASTFCGTTVPAIPQ